MTRGRKEQRLVEELWEASRRTYSEARRREVCVEWIAHHQRLADNFHGHAARHEEERRRYEALLQTMFTNEGESDERIPA